MTNGEAQTQGGTISLLKFRSLDSRTRKHGHIPSIQLGVQYQHIPRSQVPAEDRARHYFIAFRIVPSFGSNGFSIKHARIDIGFSETKVFDIFPRRSEELTEAKLQIGLKSDLTWISPVSAEIMYETTLRRITALLVAGGIETSDAWWIFNRRKGESGLLGVADLLLVARAPLGQQLSGYARMHAELGWGQQPEDIEFPFAVAEPVEKPPVE